MYTKGKGTSVPSDAQSREKLAQYVYEYLVHVGAPKAAQLFHQECRWEKPVPLGNPPGFLQAWWSVFWDLYSAAPDRREAFDHSNEARAFHDYNFAKNMPMNPGGMPMMPQNHPNMPHHPPPPPGHVAMHPGYFPTQGSLNMDLRPGPPPHMMHVQHRMPPHSNFPVNRLPNCPGPPVYHTRLPPQHQLAPVPCHNQISPRHNVTTPGNQVWMTCGGSSGSFSSASPIPFNGPPSTGSCTPGVMPSPHHQPDVLYEVSNRVMSQPSGHMMQLPTSTMNGGSLSMSSSGYSTESEAAMLMNGGSVNNCTAPSSIDAVKQSPDDSALMDNSGQFMPGCDEMNFPLFCPESNNLCEDGSLQQQHSQSNHHQQSSQQLYSGFVEHTESVAIQKLKESMQEEVQCKFFEFPDNGEYIMQQ